MSDNLSMKESEILFSMDYGLSYSALELNSNYNFLKKMESKGLIYEIAHTGKQKDAHRFKRVETQ